MRSLLLALLVLCAPSATRARAQDATATTTTTTAPTDTTVAEAQALFRRAVELGDEDRWAEALVLFRRSYALVPRPSTTFNVGFALFRLGHFREAISEFDGYLAATEGETSDLRTEAATRRGQAIASLAELTLTLDPPDAQLRVDGEADASEGPTRVVSLDPGRHLLLATAAGHVDGQREVSLLAAEHRSEQLTLTLVEMPIVTPTPPSETPGTSLWEDPLFWAVASAIAVAVGVGVGVGVGVATSGTDSPYAGSSGVVLRMP